MVNIEGTLCESIVEEPEIHARELSTDIETTVERNILDRVIVNLCSSVD